MKQRELEEKFLDYIERTLPQAEMDNFAAMLEADQELLNSFEAYRQVLLTEKQIANLQSKVATDFTFKVMKRIEEKEVGYFRRLFMEVSRKQRAVFGAVATLATVVLVVKVANIAPFEEEVYFQPAESKQSSQAPVVAREVGERDEKKSLRSDGRGTADKIAEKQADANEQKSGQPRGLGEGLSLEDIPIPLRGKFAREIADLTGVIDTGRVDSNTYTAISESAVHAGRQGAMTDTLKAHSSPSQAMPPTQYWVPNQPANPIRDRFSVLDRFEIEETKEAKLANPVLANSNWVLRQSAGVESYIQYTENPRTNVSQEPSSTFSIDVDTASYSNARRFLKEGQFPPKDSIRIEEFINYFDYNYPLQYERPFTLSYEVAPSPLEQDRYLLKLGIKARDAKQETKPWNLVFLVDVSGSMMDSNKLPLVQQALKLLVEKMRSNDKIAIVTYAGNAGVALESTNIKEKSKILSAIDALSAGGSTNGSGGITAAYELAQKNKISEGVNRVVLATDGDFNVGVTSRDELIKLIEEKRKSGVTLTALGFGTGNLNDGTIEQLANKGNGNYFYIDNFGEARKVLETDLVGNMEVVAKDVKLQIEFNPDKIASYRLIGYENRKLLREDFNNDAIDAGEIGTGHTVTAIYEVVLANSELAKKFADDYRYQKRAEAATPVPNKELSSELAFLKIRYKEPEANDSKLLQYPIEFKDVKSSAEQASGDFKFAAAVTYFAELLRGSQFVGSYTYKDVLTLAELARGEDKKGYRQELIELIKNAQSLQH